MPISEPIRDGGRTGRAGKPAARAFSLRAAGGLVITCLLLLLFAWFAGEVYERETLGFDISVREAVHGVASPALTRLMIDVSIVGSPFFLLGLAFIVLIAFTWLRWRRELVIFLVTIMGEVILELTLKATYARARPEAYFDYAVPSSYSFPSGHALGSFCAYGMLGLLISSRVNGPMAVWGIRVLTVLLVMAIGFSRVYLGVHYPTDVLAGYLAGAIWIGIVLSAERYLKT